MDITVTSIDYDSDDVTDLPQTLHIDVPIDTENEDIEEYVSDQISEITGFCHKGFTMDPEKPTMLGTDKSIQTCVADGYMMMECDEGKAFDPNTDYLLIRTYPEHIRDEENSITLDDRVVKCYRNLNDLLEIYADNKKGINSMIGGEHPTDLTDYEYNEFLNLASDIDSYCGLE
jgi:hypothetical protein